MNEIVVEFSPPIRQLTFHLRWGFLLLGFQTHNCVHFRERRECTEPQSSISLRFQLIPPNESTSKSRSRRSSSNGADFHRLTTPTASSPHPSLQTSTDVLVDPSPSIEPLLNHDLPIKEVQHNEHGKVIITPIGKG